MSTEWVTLGRIAVVALPTMWLLNSTASANNHLLTLECTGQMDIATATEPMKTKSVTRFYTLDLTAAEFYDFDAGEKGKIFHLSEDEIILTAVKQPGFVKETRIDRTSGRYLHVQANDFHGVQMQGQCKKAALRAFPTKPF